MSTPCQLLIQFAVGAEACVQHTRAPFQQTGLAGVSRGSCEVDAVYPNAYLNRSTNSVPATRAFMEFALLVKKAPSAVRARLLTGRLSQAKELGVELP